MQQIFINAFIILLLGFLPNFPAKRNMESFLESNITPVTQITTEKDPVKVPEKRTSHQIPTTDAEGAYIADLESGYIYYQKNSQKRLPMASTTKLMTAIIIMDKLSPGKIIRIGKIQNHPLDTIMGLREGDEIRVSELLYGMLMASAADATRALVNTTTDDNEAEFVALMNEYASRFGLKNTQFTNPIGYDESGHFSSTEDLYKITKIALLNPLIKKIVAKPTYLAKSENGRSYYLSNTNKLLNNINIRGVKTGTTFLARECLIALYDDGQKQTISVILVSNNRFPETQKLLEWTNSNFVW